MLPLKDNLPAERLPLVTFAVLLATVAAHVTAPTGGGPLLLAGTLLCLWLFGPGVEDAMGRPAFLAFAVVGGLVATTVAAVLGAYVLLRRPARVITLVPVPAFMTIVEVPAVLLVALGLGLQILLGPDVATAGGFMLGLAAARLLAAPRPLRPAPYRV